jgi:hypothetical protein
MTVVQDIPCFLTLRLASAPVAVYEYVQCLMNADPSPWFLVESIG